MTREEAKELIATLTEEQKLELYRLLVEMKQEQD